jgi:hypothetical protein
VNLVAYGGLATAQFPRDATRHGDEETKPIRSIERDDEDNQELSCGAQSPV